MSRIKVKDQYLGSTVFLKASNSMHVVTNESANVLWFNGFFEMVEDNVANKIKTNVKPISEHKQQGGDDTKRAGNGRKSSVRTPRKK